MSDIKSILDLIKQTGQESTYDVFVPSLGKSLKFLPMKAINQKELVKALVDSPFYSAIFNVKMLPIMQEALLPGQDVNIGTLTIYDRLWIYIQLRSHNISDEYEEEFPEKDEEGNPNDKSFKKSIKLLDHLNKKKDIKIPGISEVVDGDFSAIVGYPNVQVDTVLENYIASKITNSDANNPKSMRNLISVYYIINIVKYIKVMKIKSQEIPYEALGVEDKLEIAESLPTTFTRKMVKKIDEVYGKPLLDVLEFEFQKDKQKYQGSINVDNTFFVAS